MPSCMVYGPVVWMSLEFEIGIAKEYRATFSWLTVPFQQNRASHLCIGMHSVASLRATHLPPSAPPHPVSLRLPPRRPVLGVWFPPRRPSPSAPPRPTCSRSSNGFLNPGGSHGFLHHGAPLLLHCAAPPSTSQVRLHYSPPPLVWCCFPSQAPPCDSPSFPNPVVLRSSSHRLRPSTAPEREEAKAVGRRRNRVALPYLPSPVSLAPLRGQAARLLLRCRGSGRGVWLLLLVRRWHSYLQSAVAIAHGGRSRTIGLRAFVHPN
jgi:hypothetical protein